MMTNLLKGSDLGRKLDLGGGIPKKISNIKNKKITPRSGVDPVGLTSQQGLRPAPKANGPGSAEEQTCSQ